MLTEVKTRPTTAEAIEQIEARTLAAGNKSNATLLALSRAIRDTHPDLFEECSRLLHEAANDLTHIMFAAGDIDTEE